jgi:hypothetical protein
MGEISLQNHFRSKEFTTFISLCHFSCSFAVALSRQRSANVTLLALLSSGGPTPLAPPVQWRREWKLPASLLHCLRSILPCGMRRNVFYGPRGNACRSHPIEQRFNILILSFFNIREKLPARLGLPSKSSFLRPSQPGSWSGVAGRRCCLPPQNSDAHTPRSRTKGSVCLLGRDVRNGKSMSFVFISNSIDWN